MIKVKLTKDVGRYKAGQTIRIDEKGAAQLVESKRGKVVDDEKPAQESTSDA